MFGYSFVALSNWNNERMMINIKKGNEKIFCKCLIVRDTYPFMLMLRGVLLCGGACSSFITTGMWIIVLKALLLVKNTWGSFSWSFKNQKCYDSLSNSMKVLFFLINSRVLFSRPDLITYPKKWPATHNSFYVTVKKTPSHITNVIIVIVVCLTFKLWFASQFNE